MSLSIRFVILPALRIFDDNEDDFVVVVDDDDDEEEEEAADASNGLAAETAACSTADIIVVGEPFSRLVNKSEVKRVRSQR